MSNDLLQCKAELLSSLLLFTKTFFKLRTGRDFELSQPVSRESHYISICRELTKVFDGNTQKLIINIPPRYGKSELVIHFVAWILARYPDANFIYVCYSHALATKATQTIREIVSLPAYRHLFAVQISDATNAKDNFETTAGGSVYAAGAQGTITGRGAGVKGVKDRCGGIFIMDDMHKPDEATSDTIRDGVIDWYWNTAMSRVNEPMHTGQVYIGQKVHEADLAYSLDKTGEWEKLIIPVLDECGNALHPTMHSIEMLRKMQEQSPYVFSAQYMQNPQPAGGAIFKSEWFVILDEEPEILATFITCDTAETSKNYNDATVFSFWGIYKIREAGVDTDIFALHWLNCVEIRVEPKDLEAEFRQFYSQSMWHKVQPKFCAIEKKSSGTTLISLLSSFRGMRIIDIQRTKASGSKAARYLEAQPYVAAKQISFTRNASHVQMCIDHCQKITANDTHRFDDIADTLYDAIKLSLIDKSITYMVKNDDQSDNIVEKLASNFSHMNQIRNKSLWQTPP